MAVTLRSVFFAAVAAMILSLSACGGGGSGGEGDQTPIPVTTSPPTTVVPDPATPVTVPPVPVVLTTQAIASAPAETSPVLRSAIRSGQSTAPVASPSVSFAVGGIAKALPLSATTSTARVITGTQLMNFVEGAIPSLFPEHAADREISGGGVVYQWRWYSNGNILAVGSDGNIYGLGPYVGSDTAAHLFGTLTQFTCVVDAEMCRPRVTSVTPANGAVDVTLIGTMVKAEFDRPLDCPVVTSGTFGAIQGTMVCISSLTTATVIITAVELPENSLISVTLGGFRSVENIEMISYSWSFTTMKKPVVVPMVRVVTANFHGGSVTPGVSVIDPATKVVNQVLLDTEPGGYNRMSYAHVDNKTGVAYAGAGYTNVLHRVDVKTGTALPSFYIDTKYTGTGIHGIAHSDKAVCIVTGLWGEQATTSFLRNRLICFDPVTGNKVFNSQDDFLGDATMIPTKVVYSAGRQKYYVLMAAESGLFLEVLNGYMLRDSYKPGTPGFVVEIDAVTYAKGRTWSVGSMPMDGEILGDVFRVANAGDKSLSKIVLSVANTASAVTTVNWATTFASLAAPVSIEIDLENGVYYVSDWFESVRVMSLATDQQVGRIVVGGAPRGLGITAGSLWVALAATGTFGQSDWALTTSELVFEIDRTTRTIKNTLSGVGKMPFDIAIYDNQQP